MLAPSPARRSVLQAGSCSLRDRRSLPWTVAGSAYTDERPFASVAGQDPFDADVMLPEVTHIVFVHEGLTRPELEVGKRDLVRIVGKGQTTCAGDAIRLAIDPHLMHMQILPAHGCLQDGMQLRNSRVASDQESSSDQGGRCRAVRH